MLLSQGGAYQVDISTVGVDISTLEVDNSTICMLHHCIRTFYARFTHVLGLIFPF